MCGKDDARAFGDLVGFLNENRPTLAQGFHNEFVVNDFFAHVHGGAVQIQCFLYDINCTVNTRAIPARRCQQDLPTGIFLFKAAQRLVVNSHASTVQAGRSIRAAETTDAPHTGRKC